MKKLIYTCNYGNYDGIHEPEIKTPGWDYVLVTNNPKLESKEWDILYHRSNLSNFLASREPKLRHNMLFSDYDLSIYVDAAVQVNVNLDNFIENRISDSADMAISQHPVRHCVYDEIKACVVHMRLSEKKADIIRLNFMDDGIPKSEGLVQCGIIIRKHNRPDLDKFGKLWFEKTKFTMRDQLAFMHTYHKHRIISFNMFSAYEIELLMKTHIHNNLL